VIRTLRPDEPTPTAVPRRYKTSDGYWRLRWTVGPGQYVERLEHRVVAGPGIGEHVHHKNGDPLDNRPDNLERLTPSVHMRHHHQPKTDPAYLAELYSRGLSTVEIGQRLGIDPSNVFRALRRYGCATRPVGQPNERARARISAGLRRAYAERPYADICRNGHPITASRISQRGRVCRICTAARSREYRARKRAAA
jgi:hypothetical protein